MTEISASYLSRNSRILLLTTLLDTGGAQKTMLELARQLRERGHVVTVMVLYDKINILSHYERLYGITILNLNMIPPSSTTPIFVGLAFFRGLGRMYRAMVRGRFDLLQAFCLYASIIGPPIAALAGIPIRLSSQRNRIDEYSSAIRSLSRFIANSNFCHRVVAVCEANRNYCIQTLGMRPQKVITIYNGVAIPPSTSSTDGRVSTLRELGIEENCIIAIVVARLFPQKGHRHLVQAIAQISARLPRLRVLMVGDGPLRDEIAQLIHELGLRQMICMLGARTDVVKLLSTSDFFILPSLWEGLPNAVLEAMASRLPVIATDVDGVAEIVLHEKTGILVSPGDAASLSQAIFMLATHPKKGQALARAAHEFVGENFSMEKFVDSYEKLFAMEARERLR
jgi:L-malate glycosyltransferase